MPRPPKLRNPRQIVAHVEAEVKEEMDQARGRLSWGEFLTQWWKREKEYAVLLAEKVNLEREREDLIRRIEELEKLLEKERLEKEMWRNRYLELKLGSKSVVRDAIKFRAIAEKIEEGKSWKEICASAGFRDVDKIKDLLFAAFDAQKDENNEWPEVIEPRDVAEEFKGFVLVKVPGVKHPVDYAVVRKGHEKAFLAEKKAEVEAPKVRDPAAEVATKLRAFLKSYELMKSDRRGEERAEKMLESFSKRGLKNLIKDYGFVTVFDVIYSDPQFKAVFLHLLESLTPKKKKEVVVDE